MSLKPRRFGRAEIIQALRAGWLQTRATLAPSLAYAFLFTALGALIIGLLLALGFTPYIVAAAGAFMLVGPAILPGFFGIGRALDAGRKAGVGDALQGFRDAAAGFWALAFVCALLFLIFVTDAAILYSYMVGGAPQRLADLIPTPPGVASFLFWQAVSGCALAFLLYTVAAFAMPLLCARRAGLVDAAVASVRAVFGNFPAALLWAALLACLTIVSILALPTLLVTLPWLAFSTRALYRQVFP
jgi:uncharacterized membrane protein